MFLGLPIWFWQALIPILKALGLTTWAGNLSLKLIVALEAKLKNAKSYHENSDFPQPYPGQTNVHSFVTGQPPQ